MDDRQNIDLVIHGGTIITMDPEHRIIKNGMILIRNDNILEILDTIPENFSVEVRSELSAEGMVVLPGLINAHSHLAMTLFRGFVEDLDLQSWLQKVWKYELSALDAKTVRIGSKLAMLEMIRGGITCAHDMYWHFEETMQLAEEVGFRLLSGPPITRLGDQEFNQMFQKARDTLKWLEGLEFVYPILQTHSTYTTTPAMMDTVRDLKEEYGISFTTHASENQAEVDSVLNMYQKTPINVLHSHGLLDEHTILAHCVIVDQDEIQLIKKTGTNIVHCPESNLKLGSGIAPIAAMLDEGINICLGTDGAASNNDLDLLSELRTAVLLQKGFNHDPELLPTRQALEMITINGAKAYHLDSMIGSLEPGKKADIVMVDFNQPHLTPNHNEEANLIYSTTKTDVNTVIINGKIHFNNGEFTILDKDEIMSDAREVRDLFR